MFSKKGFTLIEVLVALAILSIIGVALVASLGLSSKVLNEDNTRQTARNLATAELEYVKNLPYDSINPIPTYSPKPELSDEYPGFTPSITTSIVHPIVNPSNGDEGVQKITITVTHGGKTITVLEGYKANWAQP
jgi:prepilin-type N-terminal cleavage/methylation domain-containing protein